MKAKLPSGLTKEWLEDQVKQLSLDQRLSLAKKLKVRIDELLDSVETELPAKVPPPVQPPARPDPDQPASLVLHLTPAEHRTLFEFSRRKFVRQHPEVPGAAKSAVQFALYHSDEFLAWASSIIRYEEKEGVNQFDFVQRKINQNAKKLARKK